MLLMKEYVLSLKEKTTQLNIGCPTIKLGASIKTILWLILLYEY